MTGNRVELQRRWCLRLSAPALVTMLLTVGCGSTLPDTATRAGGGQADDALDAESFSATEAEREAEAATEAAERAVTERTAGSAGGVGGGAKSAAPGGQPGGAGGVGGSAGGRLPVGPGAKGVTDDIVRIGMVTTDATAAGALVGGTTGSNAGSEYSFDYNKGNAAAVEAVNARGGIGGRRVQPVEYFYNTANFVSASGRQQENQRACARWTEDNQVFAFSGSAGTEEVMVECAARKKTPWVVSGYHLFISQRRFSTMSEYWYGPPTFIADRRERAFARFLASHGFFSPGAKVAVLVENRPDTREGVQKGMRPALAAAGVKVELEIAYPDIIQSPWANYVLQMQQRGITHVLWSAISAPRFTGVLMLQAAEDQRFRPRWAMGTDMGPSTVVASGAPEAQLANVLGMGWQPTLDTDDTSHQSETGRACGAALKKHGQLEGDRWGQSQCEFLFFLREAMARAGEMSPAGLAAGVARMGDGYASTTTISGATRFGVGRHDGVSVVRPLAYDRTAKQFRYSGQAEPVPD